MKIKSKLSKVTSALLAIALTIGMASADIMSVQAAETSGVVTSSISGSVSNSTGVSTHGVLGNVVDLLGDTMNYFSYNGGYSTEEEDQYDYTTLPMPRDEVFVMPVPENNSKAKSNPIAPLISDTAPEATIDYTLENGILTITDFNDIVFQPAFLGGKGVAGKLEEGEWEQVKGVKIEASEVPIAAFTNHTGFEYLELGDEVTEIGNVAFSGCSDLKYIKGGQNVRTVGAAVFEVEDGNVKTYVDGMQEAMINGTGRELSWDNTTYDVSYTANARAAEPIPADFTVTAHYDFGKVGTYAPHIESWSAEGGLTLANATKVLDVSEYNVQNESTENGWKTTIIINANGTSGATPIVSGNLTKYISEDGDISDSPFEAKPTETPSTSPSEQPTSTPEQNMDGWLTGKIMKSDKSGIPGIKIIVMKSGSADLKDQIGSTLSTDGLGNFEINLAGLNLIDSENYHIYFMKKEWNGVGPILSSDYYFYAPVSIKNDTKTVTSGTIYFNDSYQRNDFDISTAGTSPTHGILNVLLSENVYDGDSVVEPTPSATPSESPDKPYITVKGEYIDKNGTGLSNLYIVMDDWDTYYTKPDANGKYEIPVPDSKDHNIYFTNMTSPKTTGAVYNDEWFAWFKIWKNVTGQSVTTHNKSDVVIEEGNRQAAYTGTAVINVRTSKYEYTGPSNPTPTPTPQYPSIGDVGSGETIKTIHGQYLDKEGKSAGLFVVVDNWDKCAVMPDNLDGSFTLNINDREDHFIYFLKVSEFGSAELEDDGHADVYGVAALNYMGADTGKDIYLLTSVRDDVYTESVISIPDGNTIGSDVNSARLIVTLPNYTSDVDPEDPGNGDYSGDVFAVANLSVYSVAGQPIEGHYIVLDNWDTGYTVTDTFGKAVVNVPNDNKVHNIYVTTLDTPKTGTIATNDWISRTVVANVDGNIQVDGTQRYQSTVSFVTSTWKKIGDPITIRVNDGSTAGGISPSPSPSPSQKPEVGIDNMVLTGLVVEFDGQEGTEFEPYIGDALTKDNFNVTAIYTYYKANGAEEPVEAEYREGLDSADWKAPKLEVDGGLKITGKPQSFIISYTYKGETVDEVINLIGKDRPVALITGVLKDADGKGMSNYVVYLQDYETFTTTGPDGEFEFENVPDGTYKLYVTKSKKQSAQVGDVAENTSSWMTTTITVKDGIPSASGTKNGDGVSSANKVRNNVISFTIVYDVETIVKVRIEGTFKDSKDAAVKDQYIVLDSWDNAKTAGDGGKYSFTDVTSGTHTLYFTNKTEKGSGSMSSDGYYYVKADITIDGSTVEVKYTSYDGATCKTNIGDDGLITIDVALSAKNEEKSESDTLKNNASTTSAGSGKASVKGTITDTEGKQLSGLAAVIDSYDKSIDTGSSGTFTITGVTDGQHTLVIHNVSKSNLESSGNVSTSGDKVLASFSITVKEGKITEKSIGTNNLSQYGFTMEDNDATLNINMSVKAEALTSPSPSASATPTVSGNSADAASGTMSLLPKTGLDYLERSGILSGLAKIVGEDSALVKALTPDEVSSSVEGNSIQRINATTIDGGASTGATVLAIVIVLLLLAGVSVGVVVVYKGKKNRYNL